MQRLGAPVSDRLAVVFQAIGMTMERLNCSKPEALAVLAAARLTGETLADVAVDVVEGHVLFVRS